MNGLTRDGTAEPVSRDQVLRRELGHGKNIFLVELTTSRIGNSTRLIDTLLKVLMMTIHPSAWDATGAESRIGRRHFVGTYVLC